MNERTNPMHTNDKNHLDVLDAIIHDAALRDATEGTSSPADRKAEDGIHANVHARLAAMRRNLLPSATPPAPAKPIRPSLLALGRDALLARLETLTRTMGGAVQYAHRDLERLSDDDLRRLVDLIEPNPPTAE
jgi:hypothetical protein